MEILRIPLISLIFLNFAFSRIQPSPDLNSDSPNHQSDLKFEYDYDFPNKHAKASIDVAALDHQLEELDGRPVADADSSPKPDSEPFVPIKSPFNSNPCKPDTEYYCNIHNRQYLCSCNVPPNVKNPRYRPCSEVIQLNHPHSRLVNMFFDGPASTDAFDLMDDYVADVFEDYLVIDRGFLIIADKRCAADGTTQLTIGFVKDLKPKKSLHDTDIQFIHRNIFLHSHRFMSQPFLRLRNLTDVGDDRQPEPLTSLIESLRPKWD